MPKFNFISSCREDTVVVIHDRKVSEQIIYIHKVTDLFSMILLQFTISIQFA